MGRTARNRRVTTVDSRGFQQELLDVAPARSRGTGRDSLTGAGPHALTGPVHRPAPHAGLPPAASAPYSTPAQGS